MNRLLAALEPEDFACLEPHLELAALMRRQVLYDTGEALRYAYFPHNCVVSLVNTMENGGTVEVAVFGREGVLGLLSALTTREAFGRYVVQMPGTASRIPVDLLTEVRNTRPAVRQLLMNYSEVLLAQTLQSAACNAAHSVEARCCRWLLRMHDRADQDTLPVTHESLAEMLGVQRSTVSLVLGTLQMASLIQQGRGGITIINRAGLEDVTCECYSRIRRLCQRLLPGTNPSARTRSPAT